MPEVINNELLERMGKLIARELPRGVAFVLLLDNGREAAMISPHEAAVVCEVVANAHAKLNPNDAPDLTMVVDLRK